MRINSIFGGKSGSGFSETQESTPVQSRKRSINLLSTPGLCAVVQYGTHPKEGDKAHQMLVHLLELVQMRASRWLTGRYHNTFSVSDMLRSLDWISLEQGRVDSRPIGVSSYQ